MSEPFKAPFTLQPTTTVQVADAPDGTSLRIICAEGPCALREDGVHVGDFLTMCEAREAAQQRYEARCGEKWKSPMMSPGPIPQPILWTTVP